MNIYALLDKKSNNYMPFLAPNVIEAKRSLFYELNSGADSLLNNAPNDFSLWFLGSIDKYGELFKTPTPVFIVECFNLIDKKEELFPATVQNFEDVEI